MATVEERMKILKMIQEGKISAEEGAQLLSALRESGEGAQASSLGQGARQGWIRVRVTDMVTGKTKVNVNLPLNLVDVGINIAKQFAPNTGLDELTQAIKTSEMTGKIVDVVDEQDGEHVEIFIE